jgi:hypothetical protein
LTCFTCRFNSPLWLAPETPREAPAPIAIAGGGARFARIEMRLI